MNRFPEVRRSGTHGIAVILLCLCVVALTLLGTISLFSLRTQNGEGASFLTRHGLLVSLGAAALIAAARGDYHRWRLRGPLPIAGTLLVCGFVLLLPHVSPGTLRGWLRASGDPVVLLTLPVIVLLATLLDTGEDNSARRFFGTLAIAGTVTFTIASLPAASARGTGVLVSFVWFALALASGPVPWRRHLAALVPALALLVPLATGVPGHHHFSPFSEQLRSSLIAIGGAGLTGSAAFGTSASRYYLSTKPFMLAFFAEEFGLLGVLLVLVIFGSIAVIGLRIARRAPDRFGALLALGISCSLLLHMVLHTGACLGVLPPAGLSLPFFSEGPGAPLFLVGCGLMISVARRSQPGAGEKRPPITREQAAVALGLTLAVLGLLASRAVFVQSRHDFKTFLRGERSDLAPERGRIVDRNGTVLAVEIPATAISVNPSHLPAGRAREIATAITAALEIESDEKALARLGETTHRHFAWVARQIAGRPAAVARRIPAALIPQIQLHDDRVRYYPNAMTATAVLGSCDVDVTGFCGIEGRFESSLRGHGNGSCIVDPRGLQIAGRVRRPRPDDLALTIDIGLQRTLERAIGDLLPPAGTGTGVLLDVHSGEVLALVSLPGFDPNHARTTAPDRFHNRAIEQLVPLPRELSVALLLARALDDGLAEPGSVPAILRGVVPAPWTESWASRSLPAFGFGSPSGIELPGELPGCLGASRAGSAATEVWATPLQMALALAALATGQLPAPVLVWGKESSADRPAADSAHDDHLRRPRQVISTDAARLIREAAFLPDAPGNSGWYARVISSRSGAPVPWYLGLLTDADGRRSRALVLIGCTTAGDAMMHQ